MVHSVQADTITTLGVVMIRATYSESSYFGLLDDACSSQPVILENINLR